jgi:hypothetical protein
MPGLIARIGVDGTPNLLGGGCLLAVGKGVPDMCGLGGSGLDGSGTMGANVVRVGAGVCFNFADAVTVATAAAAAAIVAVAGQQGSVGAGRD